MLYNELVERLDRKLNEDGIYAEVEQFMDLPIITVHINWGDWKHEHLRCDWLVEKHFKELLEWKGDTVTETDGSDCYSATHYYLVKR